MVPHNSTRDRSLAHITQLAKKSFGDILDLTAVDM